MKHVLSAFAAFAVVASFSLPAASHDWRSHIAREVPYRVINVGPRGMLNVRSKLLGSEHGLCRRRSLWLR